MSDVPASELDQRIQNACSKDDYETATALALEAYGAEIHGWLVDRLRSETYGGDAFAVFTEDLWRGWDKFAWRCSVRGWSYVLARNAGNRTAKRAVARKQETTYSSNIERLSRDIRTATRPHMRTTIKDQFRLLREKLSEEDQLILVLRVDRRLPWTEVARVVLGELEASDEDVKRESARLRKRLQMIKGNLRTLGKDAGLLE